MPAELTFGAALLVGLLGSSHCIGMCGGIVAALNVGVAAPGSDSRPRLGYQLAYNFGRITSYVLVGLVAGFLGSGLNQLGVDPVFGRLFAAAFMIALGLYLANWWRGLAILERWGSHLWRRIQPLGQRLLPVRNPGQAFLLGALWGWLPCGLVYAAVAWSLTSSSALEGALLMLGFGLGTLPSLLLAGQAFNWLKQRVQAPLLRATAGVLMIGFGLFSAYNGLYGAHQHHHHGHASHPAAASLVLYSQRTPAMFASVSASRISTSRRFTASTPHS